MKKVLSIIMFFIIATLSGMGVGSAGLLVVWLTVFDSVPQLAAQGLNLFFFLFSSSASLLIHVKRRKMFWNVAGLGRTFSFPVGESNTKKKKGKTKQKIYIKINIFS